MVGHLVEQDGASARVVPRLRRARQEDGAPGRADAPRRGRVQPRRAQQAHGPAQPHAAARVRLGAPPPRPADGRRAADEPPGGDVGDGPAEQHEGGPECPRAGEPGPPGVRRARRGTGLGPRRGRQDGDGPRRADGGEAGQGDERGEGGRPRAVPPRGRRAAHGARRQRGRGEDGRPLQRERERRHRAGGAVPVRACSMSAARRSRSASESASARSSSRAATARAGVSSKKVVEQVAHGRARGRVAGDGRAVEVARPVGAVRGVALVLEDAEVRADGRVARRVRQGRLHVGDAGLAEAVEDVEHLALAPAERDGHVGLIVLKSCHSLRRRGPPVKRASLPGVRGPVPRVRSGACRRSLAAHRVCRRCGSAVADPPSRPRPLAVPSAPTPFRHGPPCPDRPPPSPDRRRRAVRGLRRDAPQAAAEQRVRERVQRSRARPRSPTTPAPRPRRSAAPRSRRGRTAPSSGSPTSCGASSSTA